MCGLLGAIVHGECQHDLLPEDGHDAYLSDSHQWMAPPPINQRKRKEGGGRGEVCKHVQEMVELLLSDHAIWERSLGSKNGSEGLPSLTVNRERSEKIKKLPETTFNQKRREPACSVLRLPAGEMCL